VRGGLLYKHTAFSFQSYPPLPQNKTKQNKTANRSFLAYPTLAYSNRYAESIQTTPTSIIQKKVPVLLACNTIANSQIGTFVVT